MQPFNMRYCWPLLLLFLLAACQNDAPRTASANPQHALRAQYQALAQAGTVYEVDAATSQVRIYVFRAGVVSKLGHNHVLNAPKFEGYVAIPSEQAADASFALQVPWAELVVDDPVLRQQTGGSFAGERSASDIEGTRQNMLGARGVEADQFPVVRLRSVAIEGDWPVLAAQVEITLHGVTRVQAVALHVERSPSQLKVSGSFAIRQSDFGITPLSAFAGLIKVQDAVVIQFDLLARPAKF